VLRQNVGEKKHSICGVYNDYLKDYSAFKNNKEGEEKTSPSNVTKLNNSSFLVVLPHLLLLFRCPHEAGNGVVEPVKCFLSFLLEPP
jgi:hypothetical protein